jgi:hypothetical protein
MCRWIVVGQEKDALELLPSEPSLHGNADEIVGFAEDHTTAITGSAGHVEVFTTGFRDATRTIHSSLLLSQPLLSITGALNTCAEFVDYHHGTR